MTNLGGVKFSLHAAWYVCGLGSNYQLLLRQLHETPFQAYFSTPLDRKLIIGDLMSVSSRDVGEDDKSC